MSGVLTAILILGGIPAAFYGIRYLLRGVVQLATFITRFAKAVDIINYQLVPNDGESLVDKADRAIILGEEAQRAIEVHLLQHHDCP